MGKEREGFPGPPPPSPPVIQAFLELTVK